MASDIPTFREVAKGAGLFLIPFDAPAWVGAVRALACDPEFYAGARTSARSFRTHTANAYFEEVEDFLTALPQRA